MNKHTQQSLALAGLAQAIYLVHQLSQNGLVAQAKLETSLNSLFVINPKNTVEVYSNPDKVTLGLQVLQGIFQGSSSLFKSPEVMRYLLGTLHIESKLKDKKQSLNSIRQGLRDVQNMNSEPEFMITEEVIKQLADIYQNSVSTLPFRIQVTGNMTYLKNEQTINKIRALLLAGIRSAVLWRQLGGKRWHFLIYRKRILNDTKYLLKH